jgi:hypothetical protein
MPEHTVYITGTVNLQDGKWPETPVPDGLKRDRARMAKQAAMRREIAVSDAT